MAASVLQEKTTGSTSAVTSLSVTFTSAVTAGSAIHAISGQGQDSLVTHTYSDNVNAGNYTNPDSATWDSSDQQGICHGYKLNAASGSTTVKVTFSSASIFTDLVASELGSVSTSAIDGHVCSFIGTTTTPSASATNSSQPSLWHAFAYNSGAGAITATNGTSGISLNGASGCFGLTSSLRVTTAGTQTAHFSGPSAGYSTLLLMIDEAGGSGGTSANLLGQSITSTEGALSPAVSYGLGGQTITSTLGVITPTVSYPITGSSITSTLGTISPGLAYTLLGQSITSTEGVISTGGNTNVSLLGQAITSTLGVITATVSYGLQGQQISSRLGTASPTVGYTLAGRSITSALGAPTTSLSYNLGGQRINSSIGLITQSGGTPVGGGAKVYQQYLGLSFIQLGGRVYG